MTSGSAGPGPRRPQVDVVPVGLRGLAAATRDGTQTSLSLPSAVLPHPPHPTRGDPIGADWALAIGRRDMLTATNPAGTI
jgi:hypothetical protein